MIYALSVVLFLLLLVGGILTYRNSKLINEGNPSGAFIRNNALQYSVYNLSSSKEVDIRKAIPLFQLTVSSEAALPLTVAMEGKTLSLCRVSDGTGEMMLSDAESWMLNTIRQATFLSAPIQHIAFLDRAADNGEIELIRKLTEAVKV